MHQSCRLLQELHRYQWVNVVLLVLPLVGISMVLLLPAGHGHLSQLPDVLGWQAGANISIHSQRHGAPAQFMFQAMHGLLVHILPISASIGPSVYAICREKAQAGRSLRL